MSIIPVYLPTIELHIQADRRLVFQVITAFGASNQGAASSSRVLSREEDGLLVEFHTPGRNLLGRGRVYRTVEWVVPHEPERVEFEVVEGPLSMMRDSLVLEEQGGCTCLKYQVEFGVKGWVAGWLLSILYVRPVLRHLIRKHLTELRDTIETRAKKSRMYPQRSCNPEKHTISNAA